MPPNLLRRSPGPLNLRLRSRFRPIPSRDAG